MPFAVDSTATAETTPPAKTLVEAATALIPTLRSRAAEADALARLPDATVADLEQANLLSLLVPKIYGGQQCSLRTFMDVVVEIARGDGSTAWTLAVLSVNTWMTATLFPKHVTDEVFAPGNVRTAGVFAAHGAKTSRVDGGVLIEQGTWHFNSGVHHAQWDLLSLPIRNLAGEIVDTGSALIPSAQVTRLNDWDTIGLRGSGSTSVAVQNVFVPDERIALGSKTFQEDYASTHLREEPLYRSPLIPLLATQIVVPALGMAKAALELFIEKSAHRGIPFTPYLKQDEAPVTHLQIGEAASRIDAAELLLRRSLDEIEASTARNLRLTLPQRVRIRRDAGAANQMLWEAVDLLAGASGGSFAQVHHPISRLWRDLRVASLHGGICNTTALELFGRVAAGKTPNTRLL